jgi:hypothetical protein
VTPEARRNRAAILRRDGVALASDRVLAASVFPPNFPHLRLPSASYRLSGVTREVKSPGKDVCSALFPGILTGARG